MSEIANKCVYSNTKKKQKTPFEKNVQLPWYKVLLLIMPETISLICKTYFGIITQFIFFSSH